MVTLLVTSADVVIVVLKRDVVLVGFSGYVALSVLSGFVVQAVLRSDVFLVGKRGYVVLEGLSSGRTISLLY